MPAVLASIDRPFVVVRPDELRGLVIALTMLPLPSVPQAALPRPCHLLHGRPAAKSTLARGAIGGHAAFTWLKPLAAAFGGEAREGLDRERGEAPGGRDPGGR